jgi:DNA-binding MarR family transcriptional regulator
LVFAVFCASLREVPGTRDVADKDAKQCLERAERPHWRLPTTRMFKLVSMIRKFAGPQARRQFGLSDFEWRVMAQVGDRGPLSLNELAAESRHDKGQLSRGVKRLVEAGLLVRESRRGERGVFISATADGRALFEQLVQLSFRQADDVFRGVSAAELETFHAVLDKIEANVLALMKTEQELRTSSGDAEADAPPAAAPAKLARSA